MGAIVEVKYFNSFLLKKTVDTALTPDAAAWNGSFGVPAGVAGATLCLPL